MTQTDYDNPSLLLLDLELDLARARIRAEEDAIYAEGLEELDYLQDARLRAIPAGSVMIGD